MKIIKNQVFLKSIFIIFGIFFISFLSADSFLPKSKMDSSGNVVATWNSLDNFGNSIVQVAIRSPGSMGTWSSITTLSDDLTGDLTNSMPSIYTNDNEDYVIIWQYFNINTGQAFVAASMLPQGTSVWNTNTVSDNSENAAFGDEYLALNDSGDLVLMWTSYISGVPVVRQSFSTIGTSTTWSSPITVSN